MSEFLVYLLVLFPAPKAPADSGRELEGSWAINANGFTGSLEIKANKFDRIDGTIFGNPFSGSYDAKTKQIVIKRMIGNDKDKLTVVQEFTGILSENADAKRLRYILKGTFKSDVGGGWGQPNVQYEWSATITPMLKP